MIKNAILNYHWYFYCVSDVFRHWWEYCKQLLMVAVMVRVRATLIIIMMIGNLGGHNKQWWYSWLLFAGFFCLGKMTAGAYNSPVSYLLCNAQSWHKDFFSFNHIVGIYLGQGKVADGSICHLVSHRRIVE